VFQDVAHVAKADQVPNPVRQLEPPFFPRTIPFRENHSRGGR